MNKQQICVHTILKHTITYTQHKHTHTQNNATLKYVCKDKFMRTLINSKYVCTKL